MLPIKVVQKVLRELVPLLEKMEATDSDTIISALSKTTIVGVLPPPPPVIIRRTSRSKETDVWVATFVWSTVFSGSKWLSEMNPKMFKHFEEQE